MNTSVNYSVWCLKAQEAKKTRTSRSKSYTRSTMKQGRLNGLATISLENDVREKIKYEDIIEDFISKNTR